MNKSRALAIVFSILAFGTTQETLSLLASRNVNETGKGLALISISLFITALFMCLAIWHWIRSVKAGTGSNEKSRK